MICKSCGAIIEENSKFCMECGAAVPQVKKCIQCGIELPLNVKFCPECGANQAGAVAGASNGISIGNSNAIRGDVVGKKDETNISGNATIIKNEDETKKTAKCHVCGRIVLRLEGYDCPVCGEFTCKDCYVPEIGKCTSCSDSSGNEKEEVYKQAVERTLADGKIDMSERKELMSLQAQLGISSSRALELENIVKNNLSSGKGINDENALGTFDKLSFENAQKLLYDEGKANDALNLIEPLYKKYSLNEEVLGVYLDSLAEVDSARALNVIKTLQADVLCAKLAEIDMASENKNYSLVEEKLNQAEKLWADSVLLKCRKIEFYKNLSEVSGDTSYIMLAKELLSSCGTGTTKLEKSYIVRSERMIKKLLEEELPELTDGLCESLQVYKNIVCGSEINYKKLIGMPEAVLLKLEAKTHDPKVQYALWYFYHSIDTDKNQFIWAEKSASQGDIDGKAALGGCYLLAKGCNKNVDKSFNLLKEAADKGSLAAYYLLGYYYGEQGDDETANDWVTKAANQGYAPAQNFLGVNYIIGEDNTKALEWFTKAAEQGYAEALYRIGSYYSDNKDYKTAFDWYQKAAEQGHSGAEFAVGNAFYFGNSVTKDYEKAVEWWKKSYDHSVDDLKAEWIADIYENHLKDHKKAQEWYQKAAELGGDYSQNKVGEFYFHGDGVPQDFAKAIEWFQKAAEQGNAEAENNLGCMYEKGNGVTQDYAKAVEWYKKAAEQGYAEAENNLGCMYQEGNGVTQNYSKAIEWFQKAAEQGNAEAENNLGCMYEKGNGVTQDYAKAVEWYKKAAEQGYAGAENNLGYMYQEGNGVTQDYAKAVEWYKKAAEQGNAVAQHNLGYMYVKGNGVTQDYAKAIEWFQKAAEQGNSDAQVNLGALYLYGNGVPQNYTSAVEWFRKAAEQGNIAGQCQLGFLYVNGSGVPQDYFIAFSWYLKAAEQECAIAQRSIGVMYFEGKGVSKDQSKAVEWYKKAAEQGDVEAQCYLGEAYRFGYGVLEDLEKATEWYKMAADQGSEDAKNKLKEIADKIQRDEQHKKFLQKLRNE